MKCFLLTEPLRDRGVLSERNFVVEEQLSSLRGALAESGVQRTLQLLDVGGVVVDFVDETIEPVDCWVHWEEVHLDLQPAEGLRTCTETLT